jgi:hypothetical protein
MENLWTTYEKVASEFPAGCSQPPPYLVSLPIVLVIKKQKLNQQSSILLYVVFTYTLRAILGTKKETSNTGFLYYLSVAHNINMLVFSAICFLGILFETFRSFQVNFFTQTF